MRAGVALSPKKPPLTKLVTLVCSIAALDIVLAVVPLIPYGPSAAVLLKPSEGILLGSLGGALAAFIAGVISSVIWPSTAVLGLATWVPGVVGAIGAGMLMKRRWKPVAATMLVILLGFLAHPLGPPVFLYANWDKTIALALVYPVSRFANNRLSDRGSMKTLMPAIGLIALIATEMDGATGNLIFLFEAGPVFGLTAPMLPAMFIPYTFLDAGVRVLVGIICAVVLTPVLVAVEKANLLKWPLT
jgi:hypothetical protein